MKKIFLAAAFILALTSIGTAQNFEKIIKANKWFATGLFDGKNITLNKVQPAKWDWEADFSGNGILNYCEVLKTDRVNAEGVEVKTGTYYCDPSYSYEVKNNSMHVKNALMDWYYTMKTGAAGVIELEFTNDSKVIKAFSK